MNLFQQLWQNWTRFPGEKPSEEEMTKLNELNQAVFSQLEKRVPGHIQLRAAMAPVTLYCVKNDRPIDPTWNPDGVDTCSAMMETRRLLIPEGPFEDRVELAVELLLEHIDTPGTRTAFLYYPIFPMGLELADGTPNRKHMAIRLATTPNVAVDAPEGNT